MEVLTQNCLAMYENVEPPLVEESNFRYSFSFLPKDQRNAITSIYAFCSYIDNIVDDTPTNTPNIVQKKLSRLAWWEKEVENIYANKHSNSLLMPLAMVVQRFGIPKQYFMTLIDGCRKDLYKFRYSTFEDLKSYCYSVASVVGLISIEIFGHKYEETKNYAINLGYALQLTNIIRDVKFDKDRGYIYLPSEDMQKFNYSESDLYNEVYNQNFIELMRYETKRAKEYYHKARTLLRPEERITVFAAEVMDEIYYRLLEKIELKDFNVFKKKIRVSPVHKLMITLKHWLSIRMFVTRIKKGI